jgi:NitT/TauT family transport system substrate-binding protein
VLWEPDLHTTAESIGGKVIHTTADVESLVVDGLATRSGLIEPKKAELIKFIQVWFEIMDAIDAAPDLVFTVVDKELELPPGTFKQDYQGLKKGDRAMNQRMLVDGHLNDIAQQTYTLLSEDHRHGRILRQDVKINGDLFSQALQTPSP